VLLSALAKMGRTWSNFRQQFTEQK
jgi:hypothetical protein